MDFVTVEQMLVDVVDMKVMLMDMVTVDDFLVL